MNQQIHSFLNSELDEVDYYSLSRENLLNLKQFLLQLREKENEFQMAIQLPFQSIKEKCDWIKEISFDGLQSEENGEFKSSSVYLYANDGIDLIVKFNPNSGKYEELTKEIPRLLFFSSKVRKFIKRQQSVDLIHDELHEIDDIGREIYKNFLVSTSISNNFKIYYSPHIGTYVYNGNELLAKYLNHPRKYDEEEFLNSRYKKRILTKIQIKQK